MEELDDSEEASGAELVSGAGAGSMRAERVLPFDFAFSSGR